MAGLSQLRSLEAPAKAGAGAVVLWGLTICGYVCREWDKVWKGSLELF